MPPAVQRPLPVPRAVLQAVRAWPKTGRSRQAGRSVAVTIRPSTTLSPFRPLLRPPTKRLLTRQAAPLRRQALQPLHRPRPRTPRPRLSAPQQRPPPQALKRRRHQALQPTRPTRPMRRPHRPLQQPAKQRRRRPALVLRRHQREIPVPVWLRRQLQLLPPPTRHRPRRPKQRTHRAVPKLQPTRPPARLAVPRGPPRP